MDFKLRFWARHLSIVLQPGVLLSHDQTDIVKG